MREKFQNPNWIEENEFLRKNEKIFKHSPCIHDNIIDYVLRNEEIVFKNKGTIDCCCFYYKKKFFIFILFLTKPPLFPQISDLFLFFFPLLLPLIFSAVPKKTLLKFFVHFRLLHTGN